MNGMGKGLAVGSGALVAFAAGLRDYRRRVSDDTDYAANQSRDALELAQELQLQMSAMLKNGDLVRIAGDKFSDFAVGINFPGTLPSPPPGPYATAPQTLRFPELDEALAVSAMDWPMATNAYTEEGNLENSSTAVTAGANVATGIALGNNNVRALLLGLASHHIRHPQVRAQLWRFARSLTEYFKSIEKTPATFEKMMAAWESLFGSASLPAGQKYQSGVIWSQTSDSALISSTTAENTIYSVSFPAGVLDPGQFAVAEVYGTFAGLGSGNTFVFRGRMDTAPVLLQTPSITPSGGDPFCLSLKIGRRADSGGVSVFTCTPSWRVLNSSGTSVAGTPTTFTASVTIDHSIAFTVQPNVSDPGNKVQGNSASLLKL